MSARSTNRSFFGSRHPRVFAHRGASGEAPENTIPAFVLGVEQGADVLETDVHKTLDKVPVACHDETVDRTTNGSGRIADMTFAELQQLDAGYWFTTDGGKTFPYRGKGIKIPSLAEVIATFPQMPLNIEIKAHDRELIELTVGLLEADGRFADDSVVLAAFDHKLMELLRSIAPAGSHTSLSVTETRRFLWHAWLPGFRFKSTGRAFQVPVKKSLLRIVTRRFVNVAHRAGIEVHPWTIDDEGDMIRLLDLGIDGLFTNFPARARRLIDARQ